MKIKDGKITSENSEISANITVMRVLLKTIGLTEKEIADFIFDAFMDLAEIIYWNLSDAESIITNNKENYDRKKVFKGHIR